MIFLAASGRSKKHSRACQKLNFMSMHFIKIAVKKDLSEYHIWSALDWNKKTSRACQKLKSKSMPFIAQKKFLTTYDLWLEQEIFLSFSKAYLKVHARHKDSPQKNFKCLQYFWQPSAGTRKPPELDKS